MNKPFTVDLNCDMGESYGPYSIGNDEALMPYVSSANIACGFHGGDPSVMRKTVELALKHVVLIGAHPGLPDLQGFGRRTMAVTPQEVYDMVLYQVGALLAFVKAEGGALHHVKPHGALYNMAAVKKELADAIVNAVYKIDPGLTLYGLANSELIRSAEIKGLNTANEVFADRTYQDDGTLTPRSNPNAMITDENMAVDQVIKMVKEKVVVSLSGKVVDIKADTVCIHGDGPHAAAFAMLISSSFKKEGIALR